MEQHLTRRQAIERALAASALEIPPNRTPRQQRGRARRPAAVAEGFLSAN
jgi:hypothetical protein